jgi:formate hydrogenlyase subunit 4
MSVLAVVVHLLVLFLLPPVLVGVILRTKATVGGRRGPPLLQPWYDVIRLLQKGAVYSRTTTVVFRAAPIVALAGALVAGLIVPLGREKDGAPLSFAGDVVLFAYLLGLGRFMIVLAALDTGSAFEGMGASREVTFSSLAEPVLFLSLGTLALATRSFSLSGISAATGPASWDALGPVLLLVAFGLFVVVLAENSRVPVDDPATHLELTMVHEVMVLDHSGPDYAFILYGAAVKLLVTGALLLSPFLPPSSGNPFVDAGAFVVASLALAVLIGIVESTIARLRMPRVPLLLLGAVVVSATAVVISLAGRS